MSHIDLVISSTQCKNWENSEPKAISCSTVRFINHNLISLESGFHSKKYCQTGQFQQTFFFIDEKLNFKCSSMDYVTEQSGSYPRFYTVDNGSIEYDYFNEILFCWVMCIYTYYELVFKNWTVK